MHISKLHYFIIALSYPIIILHFVFTDYAADERLSGIGFFSVAAVIYLGFVYLFFKNETGKKIVGWGLILIAIIALIRLFTTG